MRVGVTGVGRIGTMHARNLSQLPGVTEVVLHDPVEGRAQHVAAGLAGAGGAPVRGLTATDDGYAELLGEVSAVVVATPTASHDQAVRAALAAGVATLVEKPLTGDVESMQALIKVSETAPAPLLVGFQRRFDPAIAELKRRIVSGELGDLYYLHATVFDHEPPAREFIAGSGGIFRDLFIHDLDCVPWLAGQRVVQVQAVGSVLVDEAFAECGDVDTAAVTLTFEGGVIAHLAGGRRQGTGYDNRIEAIGSKAALVTGWGPHSPITSLEPGGPAAGESVWRGFPQRYATAYSRELATLLDVAAGKVENPSPARDSLISLILAQACEESLRTGHPITVPEVSS